MISAIVEFNLLQESWPGRLGQFEKCSIELSKRMMESWAIRRRKRQARMANKDICKL